MEKVASGLGLKRNIFSVFTLFNFYNALWHRFHAHFICETAKAPRGDLICSRSLMLMVETRFRFKPPISKIVTLPTAHSAFHICHFQETFPQGTGSQLPPLLPPFTESFPRPSIPGPTFLPWLPFCRPGACRFPNLCYLRLSEAVPKQIWEWLDPLNEKPQISESLRFKEFISVRDLFLKEVVFELNLKG